MAQEDAEAEIPSLTATLNTDSANVGSIVELILSFLIPEGAKISSPPEITGIGELTILSTEVVNNTVKLRLLVDRLASWKSDKISLSYTDKEGVEKIISSDPISLTVLSNLGEKPEDAQLRGIQDIISSKPFWSKYLPWIGLILLILLIGAFLFLYYYSKCKKRQEITQRQDPPHIRAKKEIAELEAQRLFENGEVKRFYFRFSEIMRKYLENLRGFPAAEYTTEEISARIKKKEDRILLPLFRQADLAKFADYVPSGARKEEDLNTALSYIDSTSPSPSGFEDEDTSRGVAK